MAHFVFLTYRVSRYEKKKLSCRGGSPQFTALSFIPCRSHYTGRSFAVVPSSAQLPWPSSTFARLGFPFFLSRGLFDDAAGFTSCYGLVCCSPCLRQVLLSMRFYAQISPCASILATRVAWSLPWLDFHQLDNACLWARQTKKELPRGKLLTNVPVRIPVDR